MQLIAKYEESNAIKEKDTANLCKNIEKVIMDTQEIAFRNLVLSEIETHNRNIIIVLFYNE